jgi:hypothetical protein
MAVDNQTQQQHLTATIWQVNPQDLNYQYLHAISTKVRKAIQQQQQTISGLRADTQYSLDIVLHGLHQGIIEFSQQDDNFRRIAEPLISGQVDWNDLESLSLELKKTFDQYGELLVQLATQSLQDTVAQAQESVQSNTLTRDRLEEMQRAMQQVASRNPSVTRNLPSTSEQIRIVQAYWQRYYQTYARFEQILATSNIDIDLNNPKNKTQLELMVDHAMRFNTIHLEQFSHQDLFQYLSKYPEFAELLQHRQIIEALQQQRNEIIQDTSLVKTAQQLQLLETASVTQDDLQHVFYKTYTDIPGLTPTQARAASIEAAAYYTTAEEAAFMTPEALFAHVGNKYHNQFTTYYQQHVIKNISQAQQSIRQSGPNLTKDAEGYVRKTASNHPDLHIIESMYHHHTVPIDRLMNQNGTWITGSQLLQQINTQLDKHSQRQITGKELTTILLFGGDSTEIQRVSTKPGTAAHLRQLQLTEAFSLVQQYTPQRLQQVISHQKKLLQSIPKVVATRKILANGVVRQDILKISSYPTRAVGSIALWNLSVRKIKTFENGKYVIETVKEGNLFHVMRKSGVYSGTHSYLFTKAAMLNVQGASVQMGWITAREGLTKVFGARVGGRLASISTRLIGEKAVGSIMSAAGSAATRLLSWSATTIPFLGQAVAVYMATDLAVDVLIKRIPVVGKPIHKAWKAINWGVLGGVVGGVIGFASGGPVGAVFGAVIGGGLGLAAKHWKRILFGLGIGLTFGAAAIGGVTSTVLSFFTFGGVGSIIGGVATGGSPLGFIGGFFGGGIAGPKIASFIDGGGIGNTLSNIGNSAGNAFNSIFSSGSSATSMVPLVVGGTIVGSMAVTMFTMTTIMSAFSLPPYDSMNRVLSPTTPLDQLEPGMPECWPTTGSVTAGVDTVTTGDEGPYFHTNSIDIGTARGTDIYATHDGQVTTVQWSNNGFGNMVEIKGTYFDDQGKEINFITRYAHLDDINVRQGQGISKGIKIGTVNSTGNSSGHHLHYQLEGYQGSSVDFNIVDTILLSDCMTQDQANRVRNACIGSENCNTPVTKTVQP